MSSPQEHARELISNAPNEAWIRALVDTLDRHMRTSPLERLMRIWNLSAAETAAMFRVSRQAYAKWLDRGPPRKREMDVAAVMVATELLDRHVKRERIPAVVRRPAQNFGGKSLYELGCEGRYAELQGHVEGMFDLRRVQP